MYVFNNFCWLCLSNDRNLKILDTKGYDDITYFAKLITCIPQMYNYPLTEKRLICNVCRVKLDSSYDFRERCLKSNKATLMYLNQLNVDKTSVTTENDQESYDLTINTINLKIQNDLVNSSLEENQLNVQIKQEISEETEHTNQREANCFEDGSQNCEKIKFSDIKFEIIEDIEVYNSEFRNSMNFVPDFSSALEVPEVSLSEEYILDDSIDNIKIEIEEHEIGGFIKTEPLDFTEEDTVYEEDPYTGWPEFDKNAEETTNTEQEQQQQEGEQYAGFEMDKTEEDIENVRKDLLVVKSKKLGKVSSKKFECSGCDEKFFYEYELTRHEVTHRQSVFECLQCGEKFPKLVQLKRHRSEHGAKYFNCEKCSKKFLSKSKLKAHINVHKDMNKQLQKKLICHICQKSFDGNKKLVDHLLEHGSKNYNCNFCDMKFNQLFALKHHERQHKENSKNVPSDNFYPCNFCEEKFLTEADLKKHRFNFHGEYFNCTLCHKRFTSEVRLEKHVSLHKADPLSCIVCKEIFTEEIDWENHEKKHQNGYLCWHCGKKFNFKANLDVHLCLKYVHSVEKLVCDICQRQFLDRNELDRHMVEHGDVLSCRICETQFETIKKLRRHQSTQSYICPLCEKIFKPKCALKEHILTHKENVWKKCRGCKEFFRDMTAFDNHYIACYYNQIARKGSKLEIEKFSKELPPFYRKHSFLDLVRLKNVLDDHSYSDKTPIVDPDDNFKNEDADETLEKGDIEETLGNEFLGFPANEVQEQKSNPAGFWCEKCSKQFKTLLELEEHSTTQIVCKVCGKVFYYKCLFGEHLSLHKNSDRKKMIDSSSQPNTSKTECEFRDRLCESWKGLGHRLQKYRSNLFDCDVCKGGFASKTLLQMHKAFECYEKLSPDKLHVTEGESLEKTNGESNKTNDSKTFQNCDEIFESDSNKNCNEFETVGNVPNKTNSSSNESKTNEEFDEIFESDIFEKGLNKTNVNFEPSSDETITLKMSSDLTMPSESINNRRIFDSIVLETNAPEIVFETETIEKVSNKTNDKSNIDEKLESEWFLKEVYVVKPLNNLSNDDISDSLFSTGKQKLTRNNKEEEVYTKKLVDESLSDSGSILSFSDENCLDVSLDFNKIDENILNESEENIIKIVENINQLGDKVLESLDEIEEKSTAFKCIEEKNHREEYILNENMKQIEEKLLPIQKKTLENMNSTENIQDNFNKSDNAEKLQQTEEKNITLDGEKAINNLYREESIENINKMEENESKVRDIEEENIQIQENTEESIPKNVIKIVKKYGKKRKNPENQPEKRKRNRYKNLTTRKYGKNNKLIQDKAKKGKLHPDMYYSSYVRGRKREYVVFDRQDGGEAWGEEENGGLEQNGGPQWMKINEICPKTLKVNLVKSNICLVCCKMFDSAHQLHEHTIIHDVESESDPEINELDPQNRGKLSTAQLERMIQRNTNRPKYFAVQTVKKVFYASTKVAIGVTKKLQFYPMPTDEIVLKKIADSLVTSIESNCFKPETSDGEKSNLSPSSGITMNSGPSSGGKTNSEPSSGGETNSGPSSGGKTNSGASSGQETNSVPSNGEKTKLEPLNTKHPFRESSIIGEPYVGGITGTIQIEPSTNAAGTFQVEPSSGITGTNVMDLSSLIKEIDFVKFYKRIKVADLIRTSCEVVVSESSELNEMAKNSIFACLQCNKFFRRRYEFEEHIHDKCDACDLLFFCWKEKKMHSVLMHETRFIKKKGHRCQICAFYCFTFAEIRNHLSFMHKDRICDFCEVAFDSYRNLETHLLKKHGFKTDRLYCRICATEYTGKDFHLHLHAPERKLYTAVQVSKCSRCDEKFANWALVMRHFVNKHTPALNPYFRNTSTSKAPNQIPLATHSDSSQDENAPKLVQNQLGGDRMHLSTEKVPKTRPRLLRTQDEFPTQVVTSENLLPLVGLSTNTVPDDRRGINISQNSTITQDSRLDACDLLMVNEQFTNLDSNEIGRNMLLDGVGTQSGASKQTVTMELSSQEAFKDGTQDGGDQERIQDGGQGATKENNAKVSNYSQKFQSIVGTDVENENNYVLYEETHKTETKRASTLDQNTFSKASFIQVDKLDKGVSTSDQLGHKSTDESKENAEMDRGRSTAIEEACKGPSALFSTIKGKIMSILANTKCSSPIGGKVEECSENRESIKKSYRFKCSECDVTFLFRKDYKEHLSGHVDDDKIYHCSKCTLRFDSYDDLSIHCTSHRRKKFYQCDRCWRKFPTVATLKTHRTSHKAMYECGHCSEAFVQLVKLKLHEKKHVMPKRSLACGYCGQNVHKDEYKRHVKTHNQRLLCKETFPNHPCSQCDEACNSYQELSIHVEHADQAILQCKKCPKTFHKVKEDLAGKRAQRIQALKTNWNKQRKVRKVLAEAKAKATAAEQEKTEMQAENKLRLPHLVGSQNLVPVQRGIVGKSRKLIPAPQYPSTETRTSVLAKKVPKIFENHLGFNGIDGQNPSTVTTLAETPTTSGTVLVGAQTSTSKLISNEELIERVGVGSAPQPQEVLVEAQISPGAENLFANNSQEDQTVFLITLPADGLNTVQSIKRQSVKLIPVDSLVFPKNRPTTEAPASVDTPSKLSMLGERYVKRRRKRIKWRKQCTPYGAKIKWAPHDELIPFGAQTSPGTFQGSTGMQTNPGTSEGSVGARTNPETSESSAGTRTDPRTQINPETVQGTTEKQTNPKGSIGAQTDRRTLKGSTGTQTNPMISAGSSEAQTDSPNTQILRPPGQSLAQNTTTKTSPKSKTIARKPNILSRAVGRPLKAVGRQMLGTPRTSQAQTCLVGGQTTENSAPRAQTKCEEPETQTSLKCVVCRIGYNTSSELEVHMDENHRCKDCSSVFKNAIYLSKHQLTHSKDQFMCNLCKLEFTEVDSFRKHMREHEKNRFPGSFKCEHCVKTFLFATVLQKHIKVNHNFTFKHRCNVCNKRFKFLGKCEKHMQVCKPA